MRAVRGCWRIDGLLIWKRLNGSLLAKTRWTESESGTAPPGIKNAATEVDSDGYAQPWDEPGLGIRVDWEWVDKHTVGVEEWG